MSQYEKRPEDTNFVGERPWSLNLSFNIGFKINYFYFILIFQYF